MTNEATSEQQAPPPRVQEAVVVNPATSLVVAELRAVVALLREIRSNAERQEIPAPGRFHFWPQKYVATPKIRTTNIVVCPAAVADFGVKIGTNIAFRVRGSAGALILPVEVTIERGTEIELIDLTTGVTALPAVALDAFITGYPE